MALCYCGHDHPIALDCNRCICRQWHAPESGEGWARRAFALQVRLNVAERVVDAARRMLAQNLAENPFSNRGDMQERQAIRDALALYDRQVAAGPSVWRDEQATGEGVAGE